MSTVPLRCKCRRQAVTSLRCARCSIPICPDCSIVAPAGMLCRECGSSKRSPLLQVSAPSLLLAYLVCLGVGVVGGWLLREVLPFGFFALWGALFYGIVIAEVALRVTGRKRGTQMEILVGVCSALGLLGGHLLPLLSHQVPGSVAVTMLLSTDIWFYLTAAVAVFSAVSRIRYI